MSSPSDPAGLRSDLSASGFLDRDLGSLPSLPQVAVVIVTYRNPELASHCVRSLQQVRWPSLRIIVVENAARAPVPSGGRRREDDVEWLSSPANLGYTGGNNWGIQRALELGSQYVLLLNDDTEVVNHDFVRQLVAFMEINPTVGLAGPRVYLRGKVQNTVLRYPWLDRRMAALAGLAGQQPAAGNSALEAELINGVCVMLRSEALRQVGPFDDRFFMYMEDADLALRLWQRGWKVAYAPIDSVRHLQKVEGYDLYSRPSLLLRRNYVYFLRKHGRPVQAWMMAIGTLSLFLLRTSLSPGWAHFRLRTSFLGALFGEFYRVLITGSWEGPGSWKGRSAGSTTRPEGKTG